MANNKRKSNSLKVVQVPMATPPVDSLVLQGASWYPVDFNKVKTIEDIKLILSKMNLGVMSDVSDFEELKRILSDKPAQQ